MEKDKKCLPLHPANEETRKAGLYIKGRERAKEKKVEESFVGMKKNPHLCDPQKKEKRERKAVRNLE